MSFQLPMINHVFRYRDAPNAREMDVCPVARAASSKSPYAYRLALCFLQNTSGKEMQARRNYRKSHHRAIRF